MVMPNNERVGRGLDAVRDGIRPVCEAGWKAAYGNGWLEVALEDLHDLDLLCGAERSKEALSGVERAVGVVGGELPLVRPLIARLA
jgi:hypothetical protein